MSTKNPTKVELLEKISELELAFALSEACKVQLEQELAREKTARIEIEKELAHLRKREIELELQIRDITSVASAMNIVKYKNGYIQPAWQIERAAQMQAAKEIAMRTSRITKV